MENSSWKKTMKNVIFLWGAISLGLIISIIAFLMISNIFHFNKRPEKTEETIHEATFGDVTLDVVRKYGDKEPEVFVSLTQKDKRIISNYQLPTHETGLHYFDIYDSVVTPLAQGKYRIMLFTMSGDCDETSNQVWFLNFDGKMNFIRLDDLFELRRSKSGESPIIGNKHFALPYAEGYAYKRFVVPVEINVSDVITLTPLLNTRGINLFKSDFEKDLGGRRDKLSKDPDQSKLKRLNEVQKQFNEAIQGSITSW